MYVFVTFPEFGGGVGSAWVFELDRASGRFVDRGSVGSPVENVGNAIASFVQGGVVYLVVDRDASLEEGLWSITITAGDSLNPIANVGDGFGRHLRTGFGAHVLSDTAYMIAGSGSESSVLIGGENIHLYTVSTSSGELTEVGDTGLPFSARNAALAAPNLHRAGCLVGERLRVWRQDNQTLRLRAVSKLSGTRIEQVIGYK